MELYDALLNIRNRYRTALSGSSEKVILPLNRTWDQVMVELAMYNLAVEKGDTVAAAAHLDTIESVINSTDLEVTSTSYLLREFKLEKYTDASVDKTFSMAANSMLWGIDARYVSGTPKIKVGTTLDGEELMSERTVTAAEDLNVTIRKSFVSTTTIYITISGGVLDFNIDYETNYIGS